MFRDQSLTGFRSKGQWHFGRLLFFDFTVMLVAALIGHDQDDPSVPHPILLITVELTVLVTFVLLFLLLGCWVHQLWRSRLAG